MKKIIQKRSVIICISIISAIHFSFTGCYSSKAQKRSSSTFSSKLKKNKKVPLYYDFGDVILPHELSVVKDSSFVYRSNGISAGVLTLKGSVEINSLFAFFENNMAKDNWKFLSSFKSPRTIMLFQKVTRWCIIRITEETFNTIVEIWVAPNTDESG